VGFQSEIGKWRPNKETQTAARLTVNQAVICMCADRGRPIKSFSRGHWRVLS